MNTGTNSIQGPNVVMYAEALYYNCYNRPAVCRFNLNTKSVTSATHGHQVGSSVILLDLIYNTTYKLHFLVCIFKDIIPKVTSATLKNATNSQTWTWQQMNQGSGWCILPSNKRAAWCCPRCRKVKCQHWSKLGILQSTSRR